MPPRVIANLPKSIVTESTYCLREILGCRISRVVGWKGGFVSGPGPAEGWDFPAHDEVDEDEHEFGKSIQSLLKSITDSSVSSGKLSSDS